MRISDLEAIVGLPRGTIRYYEKEGLISPVHQENRYRDYSEEDVDRLKRIIVLRKIGLPISEVRGLLDAEPGKKSAVPVLKKNKQNLALEKEKINMAIRICDEIADSKPENIDIEYYFKMVRKMDSFESEVEGA